MNRVAAFGDATSKTPKIPVKLSHRNRNLGCPQMHKGNHSKGNREAVPVPAAGNLNLKSKAPVTEKGIVRPH